MPKSLASLGNVVLIDTGNGVFMEREPHAEQEAKKPLNANAVITLAVLFPYC